VSSSPTWRRTSDGLGLSDARPAVAAVAVQGFAIVRDELEPGLVAAAAPIRGATGAIVAALNVSARRVPCDDPLEEPGAWVAADELSVAIRWTPVAERLTE
jgi:DNA-binding IclR family transcriptional regulator